MEMNETNTVPILSSVWREMFDEDTPDSYQPKLSNTPSLIREVCEVAKRTIVSDRWKKHLEVLQAELKEVALSSDGFAIMMM